MPYVVERAVVLGDFESEVRVAFEPGYLDEHDRLSVAVRVEVKGTEGEFRLPVADALVLAKRLIDVAKGEDTVVTVRKAAPPVAAGRRKG